VLTVSVELQYEWVEAGGREASGFKIKEESIWMH